LDEGRLVAVRDDSLGGTHLEQRVAAAIVKTGIGTNEWGKRVEILEGEGKQITDLTVDGDDIRNVWWPG